MALALVSCTEDLDSREADLSDDGTRTAVRGWDMRLDLSAADAGDMAEIEAFVEFNLPVARYDSHPGFPDAIARSVKLKHQGSHDLWKAVVGYSSARFAASDGFASPGALVGGDPVRPSATTDNSTAADSRPPAVRTTKRQFVEPLLGGLKVDAAGALILDGGGNRIFIPAENLAGDPFDPPAEVTRRYTGYEVTIYRTTADLDWETRMLYEDSVNDDAFSILGVSHPKHTLYCDEITKQGVWDKGADGLLTFFWEVHFTLLHNPRTWMREIQNCGRRKKIVVGGAPKHVAITDDTGQPVQDPVPLTTAGDELAAGGAINYVRLLPCSPEDWSGIFA